MIADQKRVGTHCCSRVYRFSVLDPGAPPFHISRISFTTKLLNQDAMGCPLYVREIATRNVTQLARVDGFVFQSATGFRADLMTCWFAWR